MVYIPDLKIVGAKKDMFELATRNGIEGESEMFDYKSHDSIFILQ